MSQATASPEHREIQPRRHELGEIEPSPPKARALQRAQGRRARREKHGENDPDPRAMGCGTSKPGVEEQRSPDEPKNMDSSFLRNNNSIDEAKRAPARRRGATAASTRARSRAGANGFRDAGRDKSSRARARTIDRNRRTTTTRGARAE